MNWGDIRSILGKAAPMLATALGGPFAGGAASIICKALGLSDNATPEDVQKVFQGAMSPEQFAALQTAEQDYKLKLAALNLNSEKDLEALAVEDRKSAREREISLKDYTPRILAFGITAGFFGILTWMLKHDVPQASRDVLNIMLGSLGTAWIAVVTYYFGSSAGSARKDETIAKMGGS